MSMEFASYQFRYCFICQPCPQSSPNQTVFWQDKATDNATEPQTVISDRTSSTAKRAIRALPASAVVYFTTF